MGAKIMYDGFSHVESKKLEPFLGVASYFARRWNREVILDAPHGKAVGYDTDDADSVIHIHFFSVPDVSDQPPQLGYIDKVFDFKVPPDGVEVKGAGGNAMVSGNGLRARLRSRSGDEFKSIDCYEVINIAHVAKNHIFILLDLSHAPWPGATPVFWEICEQAAVYLEEIDFDLLESLTASRELAATLETDTSDFVTALGALSRLPVEATYENIFRERETKREEGEKLNGELMELGMEIDTLDELLSNPTFDEMLDPERIRDEFELIHRQQYVLGLRIEDDKLVVYTEPIVHYNTKGEARTLSQYKVAIIPEGNQLLSGGNSTQGVGFVEYGWAGPFQHNDTNFSKNRESGKFAQAPCFGGILWPSIRKAFVDQDYPVLLALLLHFLDSDGRALRERLGDEQSKEQYVVEPFYESDEERERVCEQYVAFTKKYRGDYRGKYIRDAREKAYEERERKAKGFATVRSDAWLLSLKTAYLHRYLKDMDPTEQLKFLQDLPDLIACEVGPESLWAVFGPGEAKIHAKSVVLPQTLRVILRPAEPSMLVSGPGNRSERQKLSSSHMPNAKTALRWGNLGMALQVLFKTLRGLDDSMGVVSDEFSREVAAKILEDFFGPSLSPPQEKAFSEADLPLQGGAA